MTVNTKFIVSKTVAKLEDDGFWHVICDMVVGDDNYGDNLDTRTISVMTIDKDLEHAVNVANEALHRKFLDTGSNLFNIPKEQDGEYFPYPLTNNETT